MLTAASILGPVLTLALAPGPVSVGGVALVAAAAVGQLTRYQFFSDEGPSDPAGPVFTLPTQRIRARLSLELGFAL